MNELPLLDVNLKIIFLDFDIKDVITIYNYIFLESRILFFSKNIEILNNYIYGLLTLLFPFTILILSELGLSFPLFS